MDLAGIARTLQDDAVTVVFLNVLLQQIGLPVPAVPTLLLAGSLAAMPGSFGKMLGAAILASVVADAIWYALGRRFGYRVLSGLCKLSINPASCVSQTEARFVRWGLSSLVVAKFVPGFSTVAPPIAGALKMPLGGFLFGAAMGAGLWAGLALALGWLMQDMVHTVIQVLEQHGSGLVVIFAALLLGWLGWKFWQKFRFRRLSAVPHVTPDELLDLMASGAAPLLLDLRGASMVAETGPIPGARVAEHDFLADAVGDWPKSLPIITLCACPEDAGAVQAARQLLNLGYLSVRPLRGGYEAWLDIQQPS